MGYSYSSTVKQHALFITADMVVTKGGVIRTIIWLFNWGYI